MKKLTNKKGFTLIEMLVVIAIIAVLVAIIIPTVTSATAKAAAATNAANLRSYKAELVTSYLANGERDLAGFDVPTIKEVGAVKSTEDGAAVMYYINTDKSIDVWVVNTGTSGKSASAKPAGAYDITYFAGIAENGLAAAEEGEG